VPNNVKLANDAFILKKGLVAQSGSTIDFDNLFDTTRDMYLIRLDNIEVSTTMDIRLQFLDSTGTVLSGSNYNHSIIEHHTGNAQSNKYGNLVTSVQILSSATDVLANCSILIFNPASASKITKAILEEGVGKTSAGNYAGYTGGFAYESTTALRGIRITTSTGTINSMNMACFILATEELGV
jgi:hypothetical protein